ncbi:MAG: fluoride efflux transporter FluC [Acidimicrobiales bacterium]
MLAAVGAGGALGSLARYEIALAVPTSPGGFPWATWLVNVSGALALGVLATLVVERWPPTRYVRAFAGVGVCGGYTTWSTFLVDTALLTRDRHVVVAVAYVAATMTAGLAAAVAGVWLARLWATDRRQKR